MKIETDLRADWPEEAVKATVCAWQKHLDSVAKARRDSHARQKEEEAESDRLREKMRHLGQVSQRKVPENGMCGQPILLPPLTALDRRPRNREKRFLDWVQQFGR